MSVAERLGLVERANCNIHGNSGEQSLVDGPGRGVGDFPLRTQGRRFRARVGDHSVFLLPSRDQLQLIPTISAVVAPFSRVVAAVTVATEHGRRCPTGCFRRCFEGHSTAVRRRPSFGRAKREW